MIMIRHIEGRRSERVAWLLEELGVPYELDFIGGDVPGSLLALEQHHEMRMTPIVEDGDVVMVESPAPDKNVLTQLYGEADIDHAGTGVEAGESRRPERDTK